MGNHTRKYYVFGVAAIAVVALLVLHSFFQFFSLQPILPTMNAKLYVPDVIDVGPVEQYKPVVASIPIENRGDNDLIITDISTGCGCSRVFLLQDHNDLNADSSITIPGRQKVEVGYVLRASGMVGQTIDKRISFRSNDPDPGYREFRIRFKPSSRLAVNPQAVNSYFDIQSPESAAIAVIYASPNSGFMINRIVTGDDNLEVFWKTEPFDSHEKTTPLPEMQPIAWLRFKAKSVGGANTISTVAQIYAEGESEPALKIPVFLKYLDSVTITPQEIYLPQHGSKAPVYEANVLCSNRTGEAMKVSARAPDGVSTSIEGGDSGRTIIHVKCDTVPKARVVHEIKLRVDYGTVARELSVRLICEP